MKSICYVLFLKFNITKILRIHCNCCFANVYYIKHIITYAI